MQHFYLYDFHEGMMGTIIYNRKHSVTLTQRPGDTSISWTWVLLPAGLPVREEKLAVILQKIFLENSSFSCLV